MTSNKQQSERSTTIAATSSTALRLEYTRGGFSEQRGKRIQRGVPAVGAAVSTLVGAETN